MLSGIAPESSAVVGVYFGIAVMLGSAALLRRSLGALPVWCSVAAASVTLDLMLVLRDGTAADAGLALPLNVMLLPTLFMLLARWEGIPGLRRGSPEGAQRRQVAFLHQALARQPYAPHRRAFPDAAIDSRYR